VTVTVHQHQNEMILKVKKDINNELDSESKSESKSDSKSKHINKSRRSFLQSSIVLSSSLSLYPQSSNAKTERTLTLLSKTSSSLKKEPESKSESTVGLQVRSIEEALLNLLPVKNKIYRKLQKLVQEFTFPEEEYSSSSISSPSPGEWESATSNALSILDIVDSQRSQLEPAFNEDDSTLLVLTKAELGEVFIEELRSTVVSLCNATQRQNSTQTAIVKKQAVLALSEVGELLVEKYPYDIPKEGKFSYLPRLLGRTRVTFVIKRPNKPGGSVDNANAKLVGNITIVADGFAAPITAGNFVDLCSRGFYTGLPAKLMKKRLGLPPENEDSILQSSLAAKIGSVLKIPEYYESTIENDEFITQINVPVLGSFQEGFYDPLTAKPRRIPVEILRTDRKTGELTVSYWPFDPTYYPTKLEDDQKNKPVITFDNIPTGLVALNHPDKLYNFASSEFFALPTKQSQQQGKLDLLTGQYSAFGYIINNGMDVLDDLNPGDVIADTIVSDTGIEYLVKIRQASFPDLMKGDD